GVHGEVHDLQVVLGRVRDQGGDELSGMGAADHHDRAGGGGIGGQQLLAVDVVEVLRRGPGAAAALGQVGPLRAELPAVGEDLRRGLGGDLGGGLGGGQVLGGGHRRRR